MITCAANGCPSTQTTKIDGNLISFFAFPGDNLRKNQWLHNCNLGSGVVSNKEPLHLCELHFEKSNFTASMDLKSNALPTLFGRIEEPSRKRKVEDIQIISAKTLVSKQRKLDDNQHTEVISSHSPFMPTEDNATKLSNGNKADTSLDKTINGSSSIISITRRNLEMKPNEKIYRLTIQIDKIRGKPGPKCKKQIPLTILENIMKNLITNEQEIEEKSQQLQIVKKNCPKGTCRLKKCVYNSKPAFQCERCDKYYVKKDETQENKSNSCSICSKTFPSLQLLSVHIRMHFICDMCQTECSTQMTYDKHVRLHVSTDPLYPYKCHQCAKIFELKEDVKQHCFTEHPKNTLQNTSFQITSSSIASKVPQTNDYRCTSCNITFRNDQGLRHHVNSHKKKEGLRCNISETKNIFPVPNPLTGSQIGILQAVKFSCRVCSKEFDNVGEVDVHTRTHLGDTEEDLKCNICNKVFKSSATFSDHLKYHLSRAHPCPICSKAFINRTTLKIHLKTHDKV